MACFPRGAAPSKTIEALEKLIKRKFPLFHVVSLLWRYRRAFSAPQFSLQVELNSSRQDGTGRVRRHFVCVRGERALCRKRGAAEGAGSGRGDPRSSRALGPERNGEGRLNDSVAGLPHPREHVHQAGEPAGFAPPTVCGAAWAWPRGLAQPTPPRSWGLHTFTSARPAAGGRRARRLRSFLF